MYMYGRWDLVGALGKEEECCKAERLKGVVRTASKVCHTVEKCELLVGNCNGFMKIFTVEVRSGV